MTWFLVGALVGAGVAALVAAASVAPWRMYLRWLIAAQVPDPLLGLPLLPRYQFSQVAIVDVTTHGGVTEVGVVESPGRRRNLRVLVAPSCPTGCVARLEGWCTIREAILLIVDAAAEIHLIGPDATVTGLRDATRSART